MTEMANIRIEPLSPENEMQFMRFFDGEAFSDNPEWAFCYCQCFYENHNLIVWKNQSAARNRAKACSRIRQGTMKGYLAFSGEDPVGWCNAAPRPLFHALDDEPTPDADLIGEILCFLVAPSYRGKGVATALLDAACRGLAAQGLEIAEANPRPQATSEAENHFGPLKLYLNAGFQIDREDQDGSVIVRRSLVGLSE